MITKTLRTEKEIMADWKVDYSIPLLSISCLAYNHEKYIEDTLEGFLIQKTDFPFEIVIHDDASTDNTANIIREYEALYPNIIKPIYQNENQFSKGINNSAMYNFPRLRGKYVAICEGDDYWTDSNKLSLPALENHEAQLRRQLAVYLGKEPGEVLPDGVELSALHLPDELPLRLPSELARRRPDIRAAEAVWHQACANVGVATANLYPQFTLSASLGSQTTDLGDLLNDLNVWSVGGALMQPIFRGGALRAKKRAAVAAYDEAAAAYRQTVLRGLQEVADVLGALEADARTMEAQAAVLERTASAQEIARRQNEAGGISRMVLLDETIRLRQAQSESARAQAARVADAAALFHALGGGAR
jgi:hypothetical protein